MGRRALFGVAAAVLAAGVLSPAGASPPPPVDRVWIMNADGTDLRELASDVAHDAPSWSPDGGSIAYATYEGIYVSPTDGSSSPRFVAVGYHPAWSPDGTSIAFVAPGGPGEHASLAVAAPDGTAKRVLSATAAMAAIAWSPDAHRIAFFSCATEEQPCNARLSVIDADGTDETVLALGPFPSKPAWSRDGSAIAFVTAERDVVVGDPSTPFEVTNLTPGPIEGSDPDWGPGSRLAFTRWNNHETSVWLVDADGSDADYVSTGRSARWSPDGRKIAFLDDRSVHLHVPETRGLPEIASDMIVSSAPVWSPGGASLAFVGDEFYLRDRTFERYISASGGPGVIRAVVEGGEEMGCHRLAPVKLQRRRPSGWKTVERGRTGRTGRVEWAIGRRTGTFRVWAPQKPVGYPGDPDTCLDAVSPPLRIRRG